MLMVRLTHKIAVLEIIICQIVYVYHSIFLGIMELNRISSRVQLKGITSLTLTPALQAMEYPITSNHSTNKKD